MIAATIVGRAVEMQREVKSGIQWAALTYLTEAVADERYQECRELMAIARDAGATEGQIQKAMLGVFGALRGRQGCSFSRSGRTVTSCALPPS